jgi:hypothetical protein
MTKGTFGFKANVAKGSAAGFSNIPGASSYTVTMGKQFVDRFKKEQDGPKPVKPATPPTATDDPAPIKPVKQKMLRAKTQLLQMLKRQSLKVLLLQKKPLVASGVKIWV